MRRYIAALKPKLYGWSAGIVPNASAPGSSIHASIIGVSAGIFSAIGSCAIERTSRAMLHKHPHRIMSIPHRRGIDVYCFAGRYIVLEAWRTQMVAVRAATLLEHVWLARRSAPRLCARSAPGQRPRGQSPRRIRMAGSRKHVLEGFKALD